MINRIEGLRQIEKYSYYYLHGTFFHFIYILQINFNIAVSVDLFLRNPNCLLDNRLKDSRNTFSLFAITFSNILLIEGKLEIGL